MDGNSPTIATSAFIFVPGLDHMIEVSGTTPQETLDMAIRAINAELAGQGKPAVGKGTKAIMVIEVGDEEQSDPLWLG